MAKPATRQPRKPSVTILDLMTDANLLGWAFQGPSWAIWRVFLAAMFAFWPVDESSAEQDIEIMRALKPSTLTFPARGS
jgi:hypothetical protein